MLKWLRAKRDDEGFTLIELLVVIVILGILAAVVVFAVGGITDKGESAAKASDQKTLEIAEEAYYAKTPKGQAAVYATEAELVTAKLINAVSPDKDICLSTDKKSYTVVDASAACASGFSK